MNYKEYMKRALDECKNLDEVNIISFDIEKKKREPEKEKIWYYMNEDTVKMLESIFKNTYKFYKSVINAYEADGYIDKNVNKALKEMMDSFDDYNKKAKVYKE